MRIPTAAALLAIAALLAGCQSSDVGQPCRLLPAELTPNGIDDGTVAADFVATNVPSCDDLVCIRSPSPSGGYCSRTCVSNADCSSGSLTGLVCRELTFDTNFFVENPQLKDQYQAFLGPIGLSTYCATPLQ
jgi:hypothetical protein